MLASSTGAKKRQYRRLLLPVTPSADIFFGEGVRERSFALRS